MNELTNIKNNFFLKAIVIVEMISFTGIAILKLIAIPATSDGWIPSSALQTVGLFLFLILHSFLVPIIYYSLQKIESKDSSIILLVTISILFTILLSLEPYDWYKNPSHKIANQTNQQQEYEQFVEKISTSKVEHFSANAIIDGKGIKYVISEDLIKQISTKLRDIPVKNVHKWLPETYNNDLKIRLYLPGKNSEDYDQLYATFYYGVREGTTLLHMSSKYEGGGYFTMENEYLDDIYTLLQEYEIED